MLSNVKFFETLPKHNGYSFISDMDLNWYSFLELINKKLLLPS